MLGINRRCVSNYAGILLNLDIENGFFEKFCLYESKLDKSFYRYFIDNWRSCAGNTKYFICRSNFSCINNYCVTQKLHKTNLKYSI